MRLYRNGEPIELEPGGEAGHLPDRIAVRTDEGVFTGLTASEGDKIFVSYRGRCFMFERKPKRRRQEGVDSDGILLAGMPGLIVEVNVKAGEAVVKGAKIAVLEAMKTQMPLVAPFDGVVQSVDAEPGRQVEAGARIAVVVAR